MRQVTHPEVLMRQSIFALPVIVIPTLLLAVYLHANSGSLAAATSDSVDDQARYRKQRQGILDSCRTAATQFPDADVREDMAEFIGHVDRGEWSFKLSRGPISNKSHALATAIIADDGRPTIVFNPNDLSTFFTSMLQSGATDTELESSLDVTFVALVAHEVHHIEQDDIANATPTLNERLAAESEAWRYMVEHALLPAMDAGELDFVLPVWGDALVAHQHPDPLMWDLFIAAVCTPDADYQAFRRLLYDGAIEPGP